MSLLSRFFRKAPSPAPLPQKPTESAPVPRSEPVVPDRASQEARDEEELKGAIAAQDAQAIARLVRQGTSTRVRQQAAEAVDDPAQLRQLIKDVRGGNDKSVYKILSRKRDAQLARSRQLEQLNAEITAVAAALERHSQRAYDPLFTPTLEQLQGRWNAVAADADGDVQQKTQLAIDRAREVIAQHLRQIAVEASRQLAAANAAAEAERRREVEEKAASIVAVEQARALEEERKTQAEQQEARANALRQISGLIRKAHGALNEGSTSRAAGLRRAIEEKLSTAPPLPPYLTNQLQQLDKKLTELKDWKSFSVGPKRLELMEEMESLVGATLDPPVLADRIKSLQQEWRTLSKGAGENLEAEWQRFHDAAQKAYQPCREYFAAQAQLRQENLERRAALFERLAAFEAGQNWEQPNWRDVMTALRESKQLWRQHSPVERAAGKSVQERFEALTRSVQARLDAEFDRNIKAKRTIIERVQRLSGSEDSRKAIDEVKALQQQWKGVGLVPREQDQKLWEEFRQHCDAVFQKRQHEFAEYNSSLETNKSKALAMCAQLEEIAARSGPELLAGVATLADLRVAFEAIGEFPRADARGLQSRFERALERCEQALERQHASDVERGWDNLFAAAERVRAFKWAVIQGADSAQVAALRQQVEELIGSVGQWPTGGLETLRKELAREAGGDPAAHERALRMLCIRAEILTDIASPADDQQLRREYQVQRLIKNMGQGTRTDRTELDAMALEWVGVGPIDEVAYEPLLERFKRCRPQR
jgi:hypothetical protein